MNDATDGGHINGSMHRLPTLPSESTNPSCGRRKCQWNQENKSEESHGDVTPLRDILPHAGQAERLIRTDVGKKVQATVKEREEAEHAPETDQIGHIQELSQRSNRQGKNEKPKGPIAGCVLIELDRISSKIAAKGSIDQRDNAQ